MLRLFEVFLKKITVSALVIDPGSVDLPAFTDLGSIISAALPVVVWGAGILMLAYLILGGMKYLTAAGDTKQLQEAVRTITNAVVGLGIVLTSFFVVRIIETVFGLKITGF